MATVNDVDAWPEGNDRGSPFGRVRLVANLMAYVQLTTDNWARSRSRPTAA
jgi:hypothetical protein